MIVLWRATGESKEIPHPRLLGCTYGPPVIHAGRRRGFHLACMSWQCGTVSIHREPTPSPIPSATDAVAEPTPFADGAFRSAGTGGRVKPTEYQGRRVRVPPDLLKLEPFIRGYLTDVQKRDGPDATIIYAELVSDQLSYILNIDNVPKLHRFKEKDCPLIEGTKP
jgi:hypothetical protein